MAVQKQTLEKIDEMARRLATDKQLLLQDEVDVMEYLKDEEFLGLVGVQLRHKSAIIEIEETEELEICYQSCVVWLWSLRQVCCARWRVFRRLSWYGIFCV